MYAQDHEETLPVALPASADYRCPTAAKILFVTYNYNIDLSGASLGDVTIDPSTTFVTADGTKDMIELRHNLKLIASFLDGHVAILTELFAGLGAEKVNPIDKAVMKRVPWMPLVPGGTFTMGSPYNASCGTPPTQEVTLSAYWIYKYEVTVEQYLDFCSATSHALPTFPTGYSWAGKTSWSDPTLQKHPIVNLSWTDCKAYADWARVSLPTEAQWEYAARGPQGDNYPWGGSATVTDSINGWDQTKCVNTTNSLDVGKSTWPVGSFPTGESWCGVQDMTGNVSEWCLDWYGANYLSTQVTNPTGPASGSGRIMRGGSWLDINFGSNYRSACRNNGAPIIYYNYVGFRCSSPVP
jgi:prepilin-type processing-associated H-X9-DG protein